MKDTMKQTINFTRRHWIGGMAALLCQMGLPRSAWGQSASAPLQVGIAEAPITPSWTTRLWGYDNTSHYTSGVRDDIFAKAFLFDWGKRFLVFTMDVGAIGFPLSRRIKRHIDESTAMDEDAVMMQVTHNHSAPSVLDIPTTPADERFHQLLEDKLVFLAGEAKKNLAPARLAFGQADSFIALNRRVGDRRNTWDKDSGPIDSAFSVLLVTSPDGKNRGVIVNYPSHPVTLREDNEKISADFPGVMYRELGRSLGCPVAYMQGCCGDMIPKVFGSEKEMEDYGRKMTGEALRVLKKTSPIGGDSLDVRSERVILTFVAPYSLDDFRADYAKFTGRGHYQGQWAERYLRYLEDGGDLRQSRDTVVQALRLGDLAIGIMPGEILHLTASLLRKQFPGRKLMLAAYSNDTSMGYLPHADEFPRGGYEVADAWKYYDTLRTTPDMEKTVRETTAELLHALVG